MTLLSLFMTNAGIFCFIPISDRLVETGIVTTYILAPIFYIREIQYRYASPVLAEASAQWEENKGRCIMHSSSIDIPSYVPSEDLDADDQALPPCPWICPACGTDLVSRSDSSFVSSSPLDSFSGWESTSFSTMSGHDLPSCSCSLNNNLNPSLPHWQPAVLSDEMSRVMRAFTLLQGQDEFPDVAINDSDCEVVALTKAFSMLQL